MLQGTACHRECTENVEKQVIDAVAAGNVGSVQVQTVHLPSTDAAASSRPDGGSNNETFTHHFLLTVNTSCPRVSNETADNHGYPPKDELILATDEIFVDPESGSLEGDLSDPLTFTQILNPLPRDSSFEDISMGDIHTMEDIGIGSNLDVNDIQNGFNVSFYPLSNDLLDQAITVQLDKTLSLNLSDWSSPLFNDIASSHFEGSQDYLTAAGHSVSRNQVTLSQQQQSNEISSSTQDRFAITRSHFHSNIKIEENTVTLSGQSGDDNLRQAALLPSQPDYFSPANLPSASSIVQTRKNSSSMKWQVLTGNRVSTMVAVSESLRANTSNEKRSDSNMIVQKAMIPVSSTTLKPAFPPPQQRRKNPTILKPAPIVTSSELSENQIRLPEGHTYESWILQESIIKVRNQERQQRKLISQQKQMDGAQGPYNTRNENYSKVELAQESLTGICKPKNIRYQCPVCGKGYSSANGIKYHAENGHGPKKIFTCEICGKEYASKHGLNTHRRQHAKAKQGVALES